MCAVPGLSEERSANSTPTVQQVGCGIERYALLFLASGMGNAGCRPSTTSLVIM
jgi:hypothetical protein